MTGGAASVAWALVAIAGMLSVPATVLGHRGATGRAAPGVRWVKTAVPLVLLAAVVLVIVPSFRGDGGSAAHTDSMAYPASEVHPDSAAVPAWVFLVLAAGLAATALADWFLAPIDNRSTFAAGLVSFLTGYLLYGIALLGLAGVIAAASSLGNGVRLAVGVGIYAIVAVGAVVQFRRLTSIPAELNAAVVAYIVVVSNLLAAGLLQAVGWALSARSGALAAAAAAGSGAFAAPGAALVVTPGVNPIAVLLFLIGAVSIYTSDSLIAHNLFRRRLKSEELWIMPTYYVGQIAVVAGLILLA